MEGTIWVPGSHAVERVVRTIRRWETTGRVGTKDGRDPWSSIETFDRDG